MNDECKLQNGIPGTCKPLPQCKVVLATATATRPVHCGFDGNVPIVCCPKIGE